MVDILKRTVIAAVLGGCSTLALAANVAEAVEDASPGLIESRILIQGDAYHRAKSKMLGDVVLASPFISEVHYPENWDWAAKGSIIGADVSWALDDNAVQPKTVTYPDPIPPSGAPPLGTKQNTGDSCVARRHGPGIGDVTYGSMTWRWEYGYRADSNGDGVKDSDPGWYLTGEEFTPYQETQDHPILC